jgi:hypothetical protein
MSFLTRYCRRCGHPIKDGSDGHLFRCPPPPALLTWPPGDDELESLRRLSTDGNANATEMLACAEQGIVPSPESLTWYIDWWIDRHSSKT